MKNRLESLKIDIQPYTLGWSWQHKVVMKMGDLNEDMQRNSDTQKLKQ